VCLIRPTAWQADHAYRFVPAWLAQIRACNAAEVVIDLSAAHRLDVTSFGLLLAKCRDVLGTPVVITGAEAHLVETLRGLDLLAGACVDTEPCRHPRGWHQHRTRSDRAPRAASLARKRLARQGLAAAA